MEKMKNKKILLAGVFIILVLAVVLFFGYQKKEKETIPDYVFLYAENQTEDYPTTQGAYYFARLVEERSDGRIQILVFADAELGAEKEVLEQIKFGGIDFARVSLSQLAEPIPQLNVLQMPYLYVNSEHMWKVLDGDIGDQFLQEIDQSGYAALSWYDAGARSFYCAGDAITCIEDLQGKKIRVQESEMMADMVEALGAEAIPIAYSDVYSAIERGIVDGAENNWPSYEAMQHYEVAGSFTEDEHTRVPEVQLCSQITWNKLSQADQELIRSCAEESAIYERTLWGEQAETSKEHMIAYGVKVVELSPEEKKRFQEAMGGVYQKYCSEYMDIIEAIIAEGD